MSADLEQLARRFDEERQRRFDDEIAAIVARTDPANTDGYRSFTISLDLEFVALASWVLERDRETFRQRMSDSARQVLDLLVRADAGDAIEPSYISLLTYKALFRALAGDGDGELARALAQRLGGRQQIERTFDPPFTRALGHALKAVVLADGERVAIDAFSAECKKRGNTSYAAHAVMLEAIHTANPAACAEALSQIAAVHGRLSRPGGMFGDPGHKQLAVWGVALGRLARDRGLHVAGVGELIPDVLLRRS